MIITDKNKELYFQAMKIDFITEKWEIDWYVSALSEAVKWGNKIDKQNKEYYRKNHLIDKYNV